MFFLFQSLLCLPQILHQKFLFRGLHTCYTNHLSYFGNLPWNKIPGSVIPPPPYKKVLCRAAISSFTLDLRSQWLPGAVWSCLWYLRPFLKQIYRQTHIFLQHLSAKTVLTVRKAADGSRQHFIENCISTRPSKKVIFKITFKTCFLVNT